MKGWMDMRKWIKGVWMMGMCLSLLLAAGCGGASSPTEGSGIADVQAVKDRGVLKVGIKVDVPKFGFKDPSTGEVSGLEIDLAHRLAKEILGDESKVEFEPVTAKTRGPLLDNGEVDFVIATFTVTEERKKSYNFTEPYFKDGVALLVKKDAGIQSLADLNGKKIGVAQSSTSKQALQEAMKEKGIKADILEFGTYPEIKTALDSGRVDCFSVDGAILAGYLDDTTAILPDRYAPQLYGIAVKKGNDGLTKLANDTLAAMQSAGELDALCSKWGLK